jgi:hypothetical protein
MISEGGVSLMTTVSESPLRCVSYAEAVGAAARAIHGRLVAALDGRVEPEALLALPDDTLRAVGVSANKARSLRDLATKVLDGTVIISPRGLSRQSDEEVITRLSSVRGIGPWTAQMFLIFRLRRLPFGRFSDALVNLGCQRAVGPSTEIDGQCHGLLAVSASVVQVAATSVPRLGSPSHPGCPSPGVRTSSRDRQPILPEHATGGTDSSLLRP